MVLRMLGLLGQAVRSWKTALPVALLAAAGLAIGIGSATGIFSVVEAVLLKPLAYSNAERYLIVRAEWRRQPGSWTIFSYADQLDYAARNRTLETFGCYQNYAFNVTFHQQASHVPGVQISPALLPMLGIKPIRGQWFGEKDQDVERHAKGVRQLLHSAHRRIPPVSLDHAQVRHGNSGPFAEVTQGPALLRPA